MHQLVQNHGKQLITGLMDMILISKKMTPEGVRDLLIDCGKITKATKTIRVYFSHSDLGKSYMVQIKNGRGVLLFYEKFKESEFPEILQDIKGG